VCVCVCVFPCLGERISESEQQCNSPGEAAKLIASAALYYRLYEE
jgi:hypothetical protein